MFDPNFVLLYVNNPEASVKFYKELLGHAPVEASPTFAMFKLNTGVMLGLWAQHTVEPAATQVGGGELAFAVEDNATVDRTHDQWSTRGLTIAQTPCSMDFGYTFVAQDPDGHRLRVFAPA